MLTMKELIMCTQCDHHRSKAPPPPPSSPSSNALLPRISFEKVGVGDGDSMSLRNACYVVGGVTEEDCLQANIPYKRHHRHHRRGGGDEDDDASVIDKNSWSPIVFVEHVREVKRVLQRYQALVEKYKDAKATKMKEIEKENRARKDLLRKLEAQINEKKAVVQV